MRLSNSFWMKMVDPGHSLADDKGKGIMEEGVEEGMRDLSHS
jgi:hypothetical protein